MAKKNPPHLSRDVDRHGNVRWYVRMPGKPKIRIREVYDSPAFWSAYRDILAGVIPPSSKAEGEMVAALPGSLRFLCQTYFKSAEFKSLGESTRRVRRSILERLCLEETPAGKRYGELPYRPLLARHVRAFRDKRAETPGAANALVKVLRQLFTYAVSCDLTDTNPAKDVPYLPAVRPEGIPAWSDDDVAKFKAAHPEGSMARLALRLFLEFGQRISDIHRLGPAMVKDGAITFTQWKNRRRKPVTLTLPISDELHAILRTLPADRETFIVNAWGRPFASTASFGNRFHDWCVEAGLVERSAHGLRKHFSANLAEHGASDREIMAYTGHRTSKEVDRYTRSADQPRLAKAAQSKLKATGNVPPISSAPESGTKLATKSLSGKASKEAMVPRGGLRC